MNACHYCLQMKESWDLRPYGPRGALVCFYCAMLPQHKAETERNLVAQLDACGPVVVIGGDAGPVPLKAPQ